MATHFQPQKIDEGEKSFFFDEGRRKKVGFI